jgi:TCP-1/cpn60 chaperonin family
MLVSRLHGNRVPRLRVVTNSDSSTVKFAGNDTKFQSLGEKNYGKINRTRRRVATGNSARRQPSGECREGDPRPQGPQRCYREEVRGPHHHKGRRHRCKRDRTAGLHATRAAVEEGIVPGGGVALARCISPLDKLKVEGDEQIGVNIVKRALQEPLRQIAENAGEEGAIVLGKVNDSKNNNFGYNALSGEYEDLVKAGVLDPTKVVRTALTNAGSIAALMLTTEALVADITEEKKGAGAAQSGMADMY